MSISQDTPTVVLHGISWEQAQGLIEAIGEYKPRLVYDGYSFEMMRVLHAVSWEDYCRFLTALGDTGVRHTYDGWTLEMMSPRKDHDVVARLIGRFIEQMAFALDIDIQSVGQMTISSPDVVKGVQPDQGYYVKNEPLVVHKSNFEPGVGPPPDLIVEVDVTNSCVPRMPTFAALGISEIWHYSNPTFQFLSLSPSGEYEEVAVSVEFPWIKSAELLTFINRHHDIRENQLVKEFVDHAKLAYQAWSQHKS